MPPVADPTNKEGASSWLIGTDDVPFSTQSQSQSYVQIGFGRGRR